MNKKEDGRFFGLAKKQRCKAVFVFVFVFVLVFFLVPVIVNILFFFEAPLPIMEAKYHASDLLSYAGAALAVIPSIITALLSYLYAKQSEDNARLRAKREQDDAALPFLVITKVYAGEKETEKDSAEFYDLSKIDDSVKKDGIELVLTNIGRDAATNIHTAGEYAAQICERDSTTGIIWIPKSPNEPPQRPMIYFNDINGTSYYQVLHFENPPDVGNSKHHSRPENEARFCRLTPPRLYH